MVSVEERNGLLMTVMPTHVQILDQRLNIVDLLLYMKMINDCKHYYNKVQIHNYK